MNSRTGTVILFTMFLLAGCAIVLAISSTLASLRSGDIGSLAIRDWSSIVGAALLYLLAHLLRALRLTIMIHDDRVGLRETFAAHFVAAGASLLIPFKLGELFRVSEVARLLRSPLRSALLVWSERVLDLLAITALMLIALIFRSDLLQSAAMGILLTASVVVGTLIAFYVMPDNLEGVKLYFIRRYTSPWSLRAVQSVDAVQRLLLHAPDALRRRSATLVSLTLVIWMLEIGALALFLPRATDALGATLTATTFFFAQVFPSSMGPLEDIIARVMPGAEAHTLLVLYPGVVFLTFLVSSLAVFLAVLPARVAWVRNVLRSGALSSLPRWARDASVRDAAMEGGDA